MKKELGNTAKKPALTNQVEELLALITLFGALLTEETEALRKADFKKVDSLQDKKRLLARDYNKLTALLADRRDELLNLDLLLRDKLLNSRSGFNRIVDTNARALDAAQNSTKRLINRILEVARDAVMEDTQTSYSNAGRVNTYKSASTSLSVDQSL